MGHPQDRALRDNPDIQEAYRRYLMCRNVILQIHKLPGKKTSKGQEENFVTLHWPTGFNFLPEPGGLNHQSYYESRLFPAFLRGEQQGCMRLLQKSSGKSSV